MSQAMSGTVYVNETATTRPGTLEEMYAAYRDRLLRFVLPRVHYNYDAAEDIVQEAFTAALVSISGFGSRCSPYTWLCSIAQHKIADHYRRQPQTERSRADQIDCDTVEDPSEDGSSSAVESWFELQETQAAVRQALEGLRPDYERVLRRKYFTGLSTVEISAEFGRSPKAVEGLLARARQALSRSLSQTRNA